MAYMNIPYSLDRSPTGNPCIFQSIWKVQANASYQAKKPTGFLKPGVFITVDGKGVFADDGQSWTLQPGTFFFVKEAHPCSYKCLEDQWNFYYLDFNSLETALSLQLPTMEPVTTGQLAEVVSLCEQLIDNLIVQPIGHDYTAHMLLMEILLLFARERANAGTKRHSELDEVLYAMHKNIGRTLDLAELVRASGMSRTAFFARFRAATGLSPNAYMQQLKLESAKVSLDTTNLSVKEIAAALQFYDEFHFSKLFKRQYGLSPSLYRRTL